MKMPVQPPPLSEMSSQRMDLIMKLVREGNATDRYFHWDDLRRRTPPNGATATEWWFALKIMRSTGRHALP